MARSARIRMNDTAPRANRRTRITIAMAASVGIALAGGSFAWWRLKHPRVHVPQPNERAACVVTEGETRATYDLVIPALRNSDCTVRGVEAQYQRIAFTLAAAGALQSPVVVTHAGCGGTPIEGTSRAIEVPAATAARCPRAIESLRAALANAHGH